MEKNNKLCGNFQEHYAEESVDYAENTLDYAENFFHLFMQPNSSCPRSRESARRLTLTKKIILVFGLFQLPVFSFVFGML